MADLIDFAIPALIAWGGWVLWQKNHKGWAVFVWCLAVGGLMAFIRSTS